MSNKATFLSLFNKTDQQRLVDYAELTGDKYRQDSLHFIIDADNGISEYAAEDFSFFVKEFIDAWKNEHKRIDDEAVPDKLLNLHTSAKNYIEGLGFEYHWNKKRLSKDRTEKYRIFEEQLRKEGIEFSNIIINKSPIDRLDCFLDYGHYCEVFFFKDKEKQRLKTFSCSEKAKDYYRELLLSKPENFLRKIHYKWEDDKTLAMHYAKVLKDEISYDILKNNTQLTNEKMAYDFSCFFWRMVDLSAEDYHAKSSVAGLEASDCEFLFHAIGGFVVSSGYRYQWYREESTEKRLEAAVGLKKELEEAGIDMSKIIINHEPQNDCYCFLDYGDHHEFFYQQDGEELNPGDSYKIRDFNEAIAFFKGWVLESLRGT